VREKNMGNGAEGKNLGTVRMPAQLQTDPRTGCLFKILGLVAKQDRWLPRVEERNQPVKVCDWRSNPARASRVVNSQKL
jgi:hypothetical protein